MALALPALLCLASGFALVSLGWPHRSPITSDLLLKTSLSVPLGLGIFSFTFFISLWLRITSPLAPDVAVLALLASANFLLRRFAPGKTHAGTANPSGAVEPRSKEPPISPGNPAEAGAPLPAWLRDVLATAFAATICAALYAAVLRARAHPHGDGWDAFAIWNLHARFLFRSGLNWRDGFTPLLPWSHPDYPLLLPAACAHFWAYLGHDSPAVPAIIGFLFTFATVGLLFAAIAILRGRTPAMLSTIALLATPSFIEQGTAQYADVPLSFFLLATIVLLCLADNRTHDGATRLPYQRSQGLFALAGLAAAFAAWTKNEGLLFLGAIALANLRSLVRGKVSTASRFARVRRVTPLLLAMAPALLLIAYFKLSIAPPGDLFSDPSTTFHKLLDPTRYWAITRWYGKEFFRFGHWLLIPGTLAMIGLHILMRRDQARAHEIGFRASVLALALTLAGYFAVYLITPYDIYWHLRFSLPRLYLQLWPSVIFLFFLKLEWTWNRLHTE